ncbi:MAG: hypothetical protein WAT23_19415 [Chromatiaceae bacterium]
MKSIFKTSLFLLSILAGITVSSQFGLRSPGFVGQLSKKVSTSTTYTPQFWQTNLTAANARALDSYGCWSTQDQATNIYNISKVSLLLYKAGSPTGNAQVFIYETISPTADGANPDTRVATGSVFDVSTLSTNTAGAWIDFTFASPYETTVDRYYQVVLWHGDGDASNYVVARGQTGTYTPGLQCRRSNKAEPATSGDAAEWTGVDADGYLLHITYSSP